MSNKLTVHLRLGVWSTLDNSTLSRALGRSKGGERRITTVMKYNTPQIHTLGSASGLVRGSCGMPNDSTGNTNKQACDGLLSMLEEQ